MVLTLMRFLGLRFCIASSIAPIVVGAITSPFALVFVKALKVKSTNLIFPVKNSVFPHILRLFNSLEMCTDVRNTNQIAIHQSISLLYEFIH